MALRTCDPTVGSIGKQTYMLLNGMQAVRTRSVPSNPRTPQQTLARGNLKLASKAWDTLTQAQMLAWAVYGNSLMWR